MTGAVELPDEDPFTESPGGKGAPSQAAIDDNAEIARLAKLSPIARDREIKVAAARLGCRVGTLDAAVKAARGEATAPGQGHPLELPDPDPWPESVNGAALLDEIAAVIGRHVVMDERLTEAAALWIIGAHALGAFSSFPRLVLTSPEKQCGKTTLLDIVSRLVPRRLFVSNATAPALFRAIEMVQPTLLLDEADSFLKDNEELRGIVNAGHRRDGSVLRCIGDDFEPRQFSVWAAMAIAAIGRLAGTIEDRAIILSMRRCRADEAPERFRADRAASLERLARMAARWASDHRSAMAKADPMVPESIFNRPADNWRPLLAIADAAGGRWPERARRIAEAMVVADGGEDGSQRIILLSDIRDIFESVDGDQVASECLAKRLTEKEGAPWAEFGKSGKPLSKHALARLLKRFPIRPHDVWVEGRCVSGYDRNQFTDAFLRYLPSHTPRVRGAAGSCVSPPISRLRGEAGPRSLESPAKPQSSAVSRSLGVQNAGRDETGDVDALDDEPELPAFLVRKPDGRSDLEI